MGRPKKSQKCQRLEDKLGELMTQEAKGYRRVKTAFTRLTKLRKTIDRYERELAKELAAYELAIEQWKAARQQARFSNDSPGVNGTQPQE